MTLVQFLFLGLLFLVASGLAYAIILLMMRSPLEKRLASLAAEAERSETKSEPEWHQRVVELAGPIGRLALPKEGWESSSLRVHFMNAGLRGASAPAIYFATKTVLTFAMPAIFITHLGIWQSQVNSLSILAGIVGLAAFGYYLPTVILSYLVRHRERELFENFPDALDLMTVCVEAGLSLDAVIAKTSQEIRLNSNALADELHLVTLELHAGASREQAFRNLALRTGLEEIDSLVAMLIQADRFGTSIADSLRVHADSLRSRRRLRAEESAAKIPTKMLFPLIFFVFPSLLVVLLGPAIISIHAVLLPTLSGQ